MLSVIVYGRNDNHGYNMHKRIAISLNAIAEVLTHKDDEILYVDYNTSDDLPPVLEAIQDSLTDKAKKLTRVFRVRPEIHDRFKNKTHAQVNEPLARNIALRRSNPNNRWILSTNTDMVFTPKNDSGSLSDIVDKIDDGFYEVARFDVPEPLWEGLDRRDPKDVISKFEKWGKDIHLNEVVYGHEVILYDAPGDFQLALREDMFKINGFDERMILGWHVDSNLCKRLNLLRGETKSLQDQVYGYHCNHTRMKGWMHMVKRVENSIENFFDLVEEPILDNQENWGLKDEEVEEIKIGEDNTTQFSSVIEKMIKPMDIEYTESYYNKEGYDKICYSTNHILPFLFEQFLNLKKKSKVLYIGYNQNLFQNIENFCEGSSQVDEVYYLQLMPHIDDIRKQDQVFLLNPKKSSKRASLSDIKENIDLIVFDFGVDRDIVSDPAMIEFVRNNINIQYDLIAKISCDNVGRDIKVISVGIHNTRYYKNVKKYFNPIQNPYCSGIMVGYINDSRKLYREYYKARLLKSFSRMIEKSFLLIFLLSPIIILYKLLVYRLKCFNKDISFSKRRRKADKVLKKLVNKKQIIL